MWITPVQRLASGREFRPCHRGVAAMETDLVYYRRRSAQETAAAAAARDPKVRQIHLELARRYEERGSSLAAGEDLPQLHLIPAA